MKALLFIHQPDRVALKASDVSAADWLYQHTWKNIVFFHLCCCSFSQGRKSPYNIAIYMIKGNIELPSRVPWQRGFWNSRVKRSPKNSSRKAICKVRLFYFIKISCLRLLWLGPSDRFATKWHLFLTVSWRLLVFNVLGNVTNSLLLCGAMRDVNEICKSRSTTLFILTPTIYCLTMKPSKIIWTSVVFHQDTYWEAESNQLRTIRES